MSDPTDADKARMSKTLAKFLNPENEKRLMEWGAAGEAVALSAGFFTSRDALWPVLEKLAETEERLGLFLVNLARTMPDNGKTYAPDDYVDLDLVAMLIQATPAQLALAAYKTIEEMRDSDV